MGSGSQSSDTRSITSEDAMYCLYSILGFNSSSRTLRKEIQAETLNTKDRFVAYASADEALAGAVRETPSHATWSGKCAFDVAEMEN